MCSPGARWRKVSLEGNYWYLVFGVLVARAGMKGRNQSAWRWGVLGGTECYSKIRTSEKQGRTGGKGGGLR